MLVILNAVMALGLVAMLVVYALYFTALIQLNKSLQARHPDIYANLAAGRKGHISAHTLLQALRVDKVLAAKLEPSVAAELRAAHRYLVVGLACFMVMLLAGLGSSLIAKA